MSSKFLGLWILGVLLLFGFKNPGWAADEDSDVKKSTTPIGGFFYRHLAFDYNLDLKKLVKFEKRGFGRSEIVTLVLISEITGTPLKDYGKRRLKNDFTLKEMAEEAGLDYVTLYKTVGVVKKGIEAKGDKNLPPPVFGGKEEKKEEIEIKDPDNKIKVEDFHEPIKQR